MENWKSLELIEGDDLELQKIIVDLINLCAKRGKELPIIDCKMDLKNGRSFELLFKEIFNP